MKKLTGDHVTEQHQRVGRLHEKVALVVGASSLIGQAAARLFAAEGAYVLLIDDDLAVLESTVLAIEADGGDVTICQASVSDESGAETVTTFCAERWGRVDVCFLCASVRDDWSLEEEHLDRWDEVIRTNLLAPVAYTRHLLPLLEHSVAGSVIYLSSIDGVRGNPNALAWSMTKGALVPLTHCMAQQHGPSRVRFNCIAAAAIPQTSVSAPPPAREFTSPQRLELTPLKRLATPDDVASVALFFASEDSAYVTGTVLPVDGGRIAGTPGTALTNPS